MEISGKNRYQLLFEDEDSVPAIKKTGSNVNEVPKKPAGARKLNTNSQFGKENKVSTVKNEQGGTKKQPVEDSKNNLKHEKTREQRSNQNAKRPDFGVSLGENSTMRSQRPFKEREFKGSRNRDGHFRTGKREFDRQSGSDKTGVKAVDKREGAGAHNWGSVKQEIDSINIPSADVDSTGIEKEEVETAENSGGSLLPEEEEAKEMTLDEYKAMREKREKPRYNIRKPGEGEDVTQWKKMVVLNKKKDNESEDEYEYDPSMYPQRVGRLQRIVDIQFNFKDGRRGGGNFTGRGRGPRTGDRGQSDGKRGKPFTDNLRGQRHNFGDHSKTGIKIDYESQFPTLS